MNATKNVTKAIRFVIVTLVTVMIFGTLLQASAMGYEAFADVPASHWAYSEVMEAFNDGAVQGTGFSSSGQRIYDPNGKVTMAQFMTIVTRAFYGSEVESNTATGSWYAKNYDVAAAHNLFANVINNQGNTEVTREVMAQIMYNVMMDKGVSKLTAKNFETAKGLIPDLDTVSSSNSEAVMTCYYWGIITGMDTEGNFAPKGCMNRAQTAIVYVRLKTAIGDLSGATSVQPSTPSTSPIQNPAESEAQTPATTGTLTNGMPVTEENVLALMNEYKNGKEPGEKAKAAGFTSYMNEATYDAYNPSYYSTVVGSSGTECAKFAFAFWDDLFGDLPMREITNPEDVRPGDLLHFEGHWSIATKAAFENGAYYSTTEVDGGPNGLIRWWTTNIRLNGGNLIEAYTRYPLT